MSTLTILFSILGIIWLATSILSVFITLHLCKTAPIMKDTHRQCQCPACNPATQESDKDNE